MSQQVQELIDKIKKEGVASAETEAKKIVDEARRKAEQIVSEAKSQAEHTVAEADREAKKTKEATIMALQQSSRNMLLSLRKEVEVILKKIIAQDVKASLTPEQLAELIVKVVEQYGQSGGEDIVVQCSERDASALKDHFWDKLQKQVKQSIILNVSADVQSGFIISFDAGKSSFDFSEASLVAYLSQFLNQQVADIVKQSAQ